MALPVPSIDDKTFEELIAEARSLIPRYARTWTDHNVSDPGITFIELFAWLAEMQIFGMDQNTDAIRREFLNLVNIRPKNLAPAVKLIHFKPPSPMKRSLIERGTPILPRGKEDYHFAAIDDFFLTESNIDVVLSNFGSKSIDYTQASRIGESYFIPFGDEMKPGAALQIGFNSWFKEKEIQIAIILAQQDKFLFTDVFGPPAHVKPSVELIWEYHSPEGWREIDVVEDFTENLTRSGRLIFQPSPTAYAIDGLYWLRCRLVNGTYEYIPRIDRILLNCIPVAQLVTVVRETLTNLSGLPGQNVKLKNTNVFTEPLNQRLTFQIGDIPNWQRFLDLLNNSDDPGVRRIREHLDPSGGYLPLDQADPTDSQKYDFIKSLNKLLQRPDLYNQNVFKEYDIPGHIQPLIQKLKEDITRKDLEQLNRCLIDMVFSEAIITRKMCLRAKLNEDKWETWKEVESFDMSGPEDPHFRFNRQEGQVFFGNGLNGRKPRTGEQFWIGPYWVSKGSEGNISNHREWIIDKIGLSGIKGSDLRIGSVGSDAEPLDEAEMRARQQFTTVNRAITMDDFERLALKTPGLRIARARAIPNSDPDYPGIFKAGFVTVVVVPDFWDERPYVEPSDGFIQTVQNYLDSYRLITSQVRVIGPVYVKIAIECKLKLKKRNDPQAVKNRVKAALRRFFHSLTGGVRQTGWPIGRPVFPSEIYELIDPLQGVEYLTDLVISTEEQQETTDGIVHIPKYGLVYLGEHNLITIDANS
jgi:hypothetical protein